VTILKQFTVQSETSRRLDIFLSEKLNISRSQAKNLIEAGEITVNGKLPKKAGEQVKKRNKIVISSHSEKSLSQSPTDRYPSSARSSLGMARTLTPTIITETPDYFVIEKPTGLLTHPTQRQEKNTLADWLVKKYPKIKKVGDYLPSSTSPSATSADRRAGEKNIRPGIVHRLDREASGLMVVAKNQEMFEHLKDQFKNRTVEKEYLALAHGKVAKDWDEINFPITRSETADRMAARPFAKNVGAEQNLLPFQGEGGVGSLDLPSIPSLKRGEVREAKTEFLVEKRFINFTLLRVKIHTGRMHQIRVHLFAYNHPLVGDPLYIQKKRKRRWDKKLGRLFLHSAKLSFIDLSGAKQTFESPLPKELDDFLKLLK